VLSHGIPREQCRSNAIRLPVCRLLLHFGQSKTTVEVPNGIRIGTDEVAIDWIAPVIAKRIVAPEGDRLHVILVGARRIPRFLGRCFTNPRRRQDPCTGRFVAIGDDRDNCVGSGLRPRTKRVKPARAGVPSFLMRIMKTTLSVSLVATHDVDPTMRPRLAENRQKTGRNPGHQ